VLKATTILDHLIISMATCHISFFYCFFFSQNIHKTYKLIHCRYLTALAKGLAHMVGLRRDCEIVIRSYVNYKEGATSTAGGM